MFKDLALPFEVIDTLFDQAEFKTFEKLVTHLDLTNYLNKLPDLERKCVKFKCFQGVFHINMQLLNFKPKDLQRADISCYQALNTLYTVMLQQFESQRGINQSYHSLRDAPNSSKTQIEKVFLAKRELMLLSKCDQQKREKIQLSYSYLGYKLLWLIRMLVEGRKFPTGMLTKE